MADKPLPPIAPAYTSLADYTPLEPGKYARQLAAQAKRRDEVVQFLREMSDEYEGSGTAIDYAGYYREAADIIERQARLIEKWEKRVEEMAGAIIDAQRALGEVID